MSHIYSDYPIQKLPTNQYGLLYEPRFENDGWNRQDLILEAPVPPEPMTILDRSIIELAMDLSDPQYILEIGVHRPCKQHITSTQVIIDKKNHDSVYLGVDKRDVSIVKKFGPNVHTVQCLSSDTQVIKDKISELGIPYFDFIFIDGHHSVTNVLHDWKHVSMLSDKGAVVLHDTNAHPGPILLFDAIDPEIFYKCKFGIGQKDYGVALIFRRKK